MFADIANGNTEAADIFFLLGTILGVVAAVAYLARPAMAHFGAALLSIAVASIAFAFMLL